MPQAQAEALLPSAMAASTSRTDAKVRGISKVQVLGDGYDVIHCFERECRCSARQKVWEEAPSPSLTTAIREKLCSSAVALAKAVNTAARND